MAKFRKFLGIVLPDAVKLSIFVEVDNFTVNASLVEKNNKYL